MDEEKADMPGDETPQGAGDPQEGLDAALDSVRETQGVADEAAAMDLPELDDVEVSEEEAGVEMLNEVDLNVSIELGRARMYIEDVLKLGEGAVVELDKLAGDPVDIYVNERLVARGDVLVLNENFCVRVNEIVSVNPNEPARRDESNE